MSLILLSFVCIHVDKKYDIMQGYQHSCTHMNELGYIYAGKNYMVWRALANINSSAPSFCP